MPLIAGAVNIGYLNSNAEFLPRKGIWECVDEHLQRHFGQLAFDLVSPPVQDLEIEGDKGSVRLTMANHKMVMLDDSALDVLCRKLP